MRGIYPIICCPRLPLSTVAGRQPLGRRGFAAEMLLRDDDELVGFIGLGNMGSGMAKNLVQKGRKVLAFDLNTSLLDDRIVWAQSPADVASHSKLIISMLPNNDAVKAVYKGSDGVLEGLQDGSLLIDSSTIDPAVSQELAKEVKAKGAAFVDAPVSGGVIAAKAGSLTFMVGAANETDFEKAQSVLSYMGKTVYHCGSVGTGQAVKICNNMLLAISMIGVSETMNLGIRLGLDPKLLTSILSSATGRCWSVDTYNPVPGVMQDVPSSNQYEGGFGSQLMLKDLGLAQDAATRTGTATPLGAQAMHIYRIMCNSGYASKDFSSAFQFLGRDTKLSG